MAIKLGLNLGYFGIGPQGEEAAALVAALASHLGGSSAEPKEAS